jgi:hypothetical protein
VDSPCRVEFVTLTIGNRVGQVGQQLVRASLGERLFQRPYVVPFLPSLHKDE